MASRKIQEQCLREMLEDKELPLYRSRPLSSINKKKAVAI